LATPANYTAAVTEAQNIYTAGNTLLTDPANFMSAGDYTDAAMDHAIAAMMLTEIPDEVLIVSQLEELLALVPGT
jgi:hypothetical protein